MKRNISKKAVVLRLGLMGWKLYTRNERKFEANPEYIFRVYFLAFFTVYSFVLLLVLLVSIKVWVFLELFLILLSWLYGFWASKFFAKYF